MAKLVWRNKARQDVRRIIAHIAEDDPDAAERLGDQIEATARRLPRYPRLYRTGRVPGTREAVVHPNYILVYRLIDDGIEVLAVLHARQNYP
ncbi:type II toxin-antitoxin system RelE/ParE family toxin [Caulobacter sp. LARHSG274]